MSQTKRFQRLRLVLPDTEDWRTLAWIGWIDGQPPTHGTSTLAALPGADRVEVILPAGRVSMHALTVPVQPGRHLDALIAQTMEDRLLGDKTDALIVAGPQTGTECHVWASSRRWLEAALERLQAAGIETTALLPEYALLPSEHGTITHAVGIGATIFRTPDNRFGRVADVATIDALSPGIPRREVSNHLTSFWPDGWPGTLPRSLVRFTPRRVDPRQWIPALRWGALCVVLMLLGDVITWRQLESREARLQHEIRQTFATTFPGTPVIDPALQWESKLRETGQSGRDALDATLELAARTAAPIHPLQIEAGDGFVRLTLSENEVAQFRTQLESASKPESSPSELGSGMLRLHYRSTP